MSAKGVELSDLKKRAQSNAEAEAPRRVKMRRGTIEPSEEEFVGNSIRTSKYTALNFFPKNLFEQITRPANAYFVGIAVLQIIPSISLTQGQPTILLPLLFVVGVSMLKDAFEDYSRHQADRRENEREYQVLQGGGLVKVQSLGLRVGDIVHIVDEETFPADLLLLHSGTEDGSYCYVETANLDGETNLKIKMVPEVTKDIKQKEDLDRLDIDLMVDGPNGKLDAFGGMIQSPGGREILLSIDNLLLRGSKLRNTGYVFGLVLYTGEQSKIRMNSQERRRNIIKRSRLEKYINKQMKLTVCLQLVVCLGAGIGAGHWQEQHSAHTYYLNFTDSPAVVGVLQFFTWFIVFAYLVPISLLVSMEMVKFWQGVFIGWDLNMMHVVGGEQQFARAQTSGLNEELGYVQYVLSDKTGTLTENKMDFRKCVIGGKQYGSGETDISRAARARGSFTSKLPPKRHPEDDAEHELAPHVHFNARNRLTATIRNEVEGRLVEEFLASLALSNTVFPTLSKQGNPILKASSPDEQALVEFARFMGYELYERNTPNVTLRVRLPDAARSAPFRFPVYEQLAVLDFTSKRKRMSVILRSPEGKIKIYIKGADSIVKPFLRGSEHGDAGLARAQPNWDFTYKCLAEFGDEGLRTLLVAQATHDAAWWDDPQHGWATRYRQGLKEFAVEGPNEEGHFKGGCKDACRRCSLETAIERAAGFDLIGATAIEDKLQEDVPTTIKALLDGGVNVWVLTGDKLETAINIGMACNLLESSMERKGNLLRIDGLDKHTIKDQILRHMAHLRYLREIEKSTENTGLVITSDSFALLMDGPYEGMKEEEKELLRCFLYVATRCKSVVGCRMQPNQKAQIVQLVKQTQLSTTLAVGDGANDEQMIRVADVGVGIRGVEGTTAVRAADYAISQFKFLRRLLFVHGRNNYRRISVLISYIFYKNTIVSFISLWYGLYTGFSGQPLVLTWAFQAYNILFTAFPIIIFAVFDQDVEPKLLMNDPKYYKDARGAFFNMIIFWKWMLFGLLQSVLTLFVPLSVYESTSLDNTGQSSGLWEMGLVTYNVCVFVVNFKLAMITASWTRLHHFTMWGSFFLYFFVMTVLNGSPIFSNAGADYTWTLFRIWSTPKYWFTVSACVVLVLYLDWLIFCLDRLNIAKKLLPSTIEKWLLDTFPISPSPPSEYLAKTIVQPKKSEEIISEFPSSSSSPATPVREGKREEGKVEVSDDRLSPPSHPPIPHTGYAFDYTPHEAERVERRASMVMAIPMTND